MAGIRPRTSGLGSCKALLLYSQKLYGRDTRKDAIAMRRADDKRISSESKQFIAYFSGLICLAGWRANARQREIT